MKAKLINVGRQRFCGEVNINTTKGLMREIHKHVMSRGVTLEYEDGSKKANIIVGGFRKVGEVELVDGVFRSVDAIETLITETEK